MSAVAIRNRLLGRVRMVHLAAVAGLLLAALVAMGFAYRAPARDSATASVQLTPARAAAIVAATSADRSEIKAFGDQAKLINASLPFSGSPVEAARPFAIGGKDLDHRRALLCLTQAIYYEAGFEPADGRRAVAQVILNRMRHPAFPKSVCGVVYQGAGSPVCQFTFVCDGSLYRAPALGAWRQAQDIARKALGGYVEPSVGAATHYHADYVAPRWAPMLAKITKIGAHIFYRWPGALGRQAAFTGRYIGEPNDPSALRPPMPTTLEPTIEEVIAAGPITDGTLLKRAPTDVGGLLDVSKGWTLHIPGPDEVSSASSRAVARQQQRPTVPPATESVSAVAPAAAPVVASR